MGATDFLGPSSTALDNIKDVEGAFEDTASYPALTFDPAPGDANKVSSLAGRFSSVATKLGNARDALNDIGQSESIWQGDAADAFRSKVGDLPGYLDKANTSLGDAAKTLDQWSADLTTLQRTAADYEQQAEQAIQRVSQAQANPNLGLAGEEFSTPQALRQAQSELNAATEELDAAQQELSRIRSLAAQLLQRHETMANQVADALRKAKDEAPEEPGLLSRALSALGDIVHGITQAAEDIGQWFKDHAEEIGKIGTVLAKIGNVLSIVAAATAWVPGLGEVTAAAALGVNGAALAVQAVAKISGDKDISMMDLAGDALNMIPGGKVASAAKNIAKDAATDIGKTALKDAKGVFTSGGVKTLVTDTKAAIKDAKGTITDLGDAAKRAKAVDANAAKVFKEATENYNKVAGKLGLKSVTDATEHGGAIVAGYTVAKNLAGTAAGDAAVNAISDANQPAGTAAGVAKSLGEETGVQKGIESAASVFSKVAGKKAA